MLPEAASPAAIEQAPPKKEAFTLIVGSLRLELPSVILKQSEDLFAGGKSRLLFTEPALRKELLKSSLRHCLALAKSRACSGELADFVRALRAVYSQAVDPDDRLTVREVRDALAELRVSALERRILEDLLLKYISVEQRAVRGEEPMQVDA